MNLSLSDIRTAEDAQRAADILRAILLVLQPADTPVVDTPVADTPVVDMPLVDTPVPVADTPTKPRRARKTNGATPEANPVAEEPPAPIANPEVDDAAREKLRELAVKNGVIWLRQLLADYGAAKFTDLTPAQVHEALNAGA